jgi:NAD-dependent SIR2 family protein deacetylase
METFLDDLEPLEDILEKKIFDNELFIFPTKEEKQLELENYIKNDNIFFEEYKDKNKIFIREIKELLKKIENIKTFFIFPTSIFFYSIKIYIIFSELFGSETITLEYDYVKKIIKEKNAENYKKFSNFIETYPNVLQKIEEIEKVCQTINHGLF